MVAVSFFQDNSLSGTGAVDLSGSAADSSTTIDAGDTIAFAGNKSTLDVSDTAYVDDAGTTNFVNSTGSINGVSVTAATRVEYNYNLLAEDPTTGLYHRIDVYAFGSDGNKGYLVSRAWDPDTGDFADPVVPYNGGTLTILDSSSTDSQGRSIDTNDPDLEVFMRDTSLQLSPYNNDASGGVMGDLVVCFCEGTQIATDQGLKNVEDLVAGDLVETLDNGFQAVRWVFARQISLAKMITTPKIAPITIRKGALGDGTPAHDLSVSPQHRILIKGPIAKRMFDHDEVLVAAKHLLSLDGVETAPAPKTVCYVHFLCDRHEVVYANGALAESLLVGPEAIKSLPDEALEELRELIPDFEDLMLSKERPASARHLISGKKGRELAHHMRESLEAHSGALA